MKMSLVDWMGLAKQSKNRSEFRFITLSEDTQKLSRPRRSHSRRFKTVMKRVHESLSAREE